jgi:C1A family cysteine protease
VLAPKQADRWLQRTALCLAVGLLLVAALAPGATLGADGGSEVQVAPMRPATNVPHPPGTGFIPPQMDLSHLTGQTLPRGARPEALPAAFDWRDSGKVTVPKNQGGCGSCYAFAFLGNFESRLLIDGAGTQDLSENHAKECNWKELNDYHDTMSNAVGSCDGGNSYMIANLYTQTGSVLETCDPYQASDVGCKVGCDYQQSVLDFRMISGKSKPNAEVLKQYIYDYGPIITTVFIDDTGGSIYTYDGSTTLDYEAPVDGTNHGVVIVGWSNDLPPVTGSSTRAEGWIVKNSWGSTWGDDGYFYITYGSGNIGYYSAFVQDWQPYDSHGDLWYYDEDGWQGSFGFTVSTTIWGLAKYVPNADTNVTRVEFWTTDATTDVDVYLYDSFDGTSTSGLLASELNNSFAEAGYHSVALTSPVPVTTGNDVVAVVKFTNDGSRHPLAFDSNGSIETGRTYYSRTGASGTWTDLSSLPADATIRLRTSASIPAPAVASIAPNTGRNTGTLHVTSLAGTYFQPEAGVKLTRPGQADIDATNEVLVNSARITCDLDLTGAVTGTWNVVVTNPDGQRGTLANGFTVTDPSWYQVVYLPLVTRH